VSVNEDKKESGSEGCTKGLGILQTSPNISECDTDWFRSFMEGTRRVRSCHGRSEGEGSEGQGRHGPSLVDASTEGGVHKVESSP
jgi:hypothetical protein